MAQLPAAPLPRAAALLVATVGWCILFQVIMDGWVSFLRRCGAFKRTARAPAHSTSTMLLHSVLGWGGYVAPWCLVEGFWPRAWSYLLPSLWVVAYSTLALLFIIDVYYFFVHRWFHAAWNKAGFALLHAKHHTAVGNLDVHSASYVGFWGGVVEGGIPTAATYVLLHALTGNLWAFLHALHTVAGLICVGHVGHDVRCDHPAALPWLGVWPLLFMQWTMPVRMAPQEHEMHHKDPRTNMAPFFTWLDDWFGSAGSPRHPCTALYVAVHMAYQAVLVATLSWFTSAPGAAVAAYCVAYCFVPAAGVSWVLNACCVPEGVRWCLGWLQDAYRRDALITFAPAGQPGCFFLGDTALDSAGAKQPACLFACHPTGVLSRGALLTFAARGWGSPVSSLARVRLAVGHQLVNLPIPGSREFLLAIGCVPADRPVLKQLLEGGTSVAVAPGGWSEPMHTGTYKLLLQQRVGFISLAAETGAHLVPTLCLGEHLLATDLEFTIKGRQPPLATNWINRLLLSRRPQPVQVVFGRPLVPTEGEGVAALHARYVTALQALAGDHGIKLDIV